MARVLVALAPGFEELEAVTVIDLLRRADIEVCAAAVPRTTDSEPALQGTDAGVVIGSHGIGVQADVQLSGVDDAGFDMIVLPGGMPGASHLRNDPQLRGMLQRVSDRGGYVAAICAAPSVLAHAGLLDGRAATSFPGFLDTTVAPRVRLSSAAVVVDGRIITSRGPGTAIDFALTLIELLVGERVRAEVESRLQRPPPA